MPCIKGTIGLWYIHTLITVLINFGEIVLCDSGRDLSITSCYISHSTYHKLCYAMLLCLFYACPKISNCLSQHSCFLWCRLLCHSNIRSCSLMCLALSQHHTALALSCALLCLSITLLLLSHVPCFVSASRCCSLMCLALSQHHAVALSCALLCLSITLLMCLALSQHATRRSSVLCLVQATRSLSSTRTWNKVVQCQWLWNIRLSNELERGGIYGKTYAYIDT